MVKIEKNHFLTMQNKSVLFVCTGNVCRSPVAEAIFSKMTDNRIKSDSAAISAHHVNEQADERAIEIVKEHGIDMSQHRVRQIRYDDWLLYDYIVALDKKVYNALKNMKPNTSKTHIVLLGDIKDPYFSGRSGFQKMYDEIAKSMPSFMAQNNLSNMS